MSSQAITVSFRNEALQGIHLAADTYKVALFTSSAALDEDTTAYSSTNEASGTGYTAGGATLSGFNASIQTSTGVSISITRSSQTATVTHTGHGFVSGQTVRVSGATQTEYNGTFRITVTDANTYTYTVTGSPATPATGSPVAAYKVATLSFTNPSWASSTITARYAVIYNSTRSNKSVMVIDFGSDITSTAGTFTITLPTQNATSALIRW